MSYNFKIYFWIILYKVVLEVVYFAFVSPNYSYSGLIWNPSAIKFLVSYFSLLLLLLALPLGENKPSNQLAQILFIITVIPVLSIFWQADLSINYFSYVVFCCLFLFLFIRISKPIKITYIKFETKNYMTFVNIVCFLTLTLLILFTINYGGIDPRALSFNEIYELRAETEYSLLWGYLINWISKLLLPFCIVLYLIKEKKLMLVITCCMQVYFYLCTGHKQILFSVLFLIIFTFLLKRNKFTIGVPIFYTIAILCSSFLFILTNNFFTISLLPIRQLNIPAMLSFIHYDFFSHNPKLYFSEGLIGTILGLESPYPIHSTFLVSPTEGTNANTGFLADAYDNGGFLLMVIYTLILGVILLFIDSISKGSKARYMYTALMLYTIVILNDSALLTTLLTSGSIILILFLYVVASGEKEKGT